MIGNKLEFSQHNFDVLVQAYDELKAQYADRGASMRDTGEIVRSLFMPYLRRIKAALLLPDDLDSLTEIAKVLKELQAHTPIGDL